MIGSLLDTFLDRTVVAGYSSIGYRIRSRNWEATELRRLDGKVAVISGATSGIGLAAADGLARLGASVRLLARSEERGERARAAIATRTKNSDVRVNVCDLSMLESVRQCAAMIVDQEHQIDVLVNNAGVLPPERTLSVDGIELAFATNVLGPFLLTNLLIPALACGGAARVINVSSGGMYTQRIHVEDLQMTHEPFDGVVAYARAKRAEVILTELWAERLKGSGIVVHAMHPGWADTPGVQTSLPRFYRLTQPLLRTPEQAADTIVWLAAAPEGGASSGRFWHDRRQRPTHVRPGTKETDEDRERLWTQCAELSGWRGC